MRRNGHGLAEGAEEQVDEPARRLDVAGRDRGGRPGVDEATLRRAHGHRLERAGLEKAAPDFAWSDYFTALGVGNVAAINVAQPEFIKGFDALLLAGAPCVAEAPALQKTWSDLQADKAPVDFVGIDFREDPARGAAFARKAGITYPSLSDESGVALLALQGKAPTTPTTLVLDTEGRIAARVNGPASASTLRGLVDDVVAGS